MKRTKRTTRKRTKATKSGRKRFINMLNSAVNPPPPPTTWDDWLALARHERLITRRDTHWPVVDVITRVVADAREQIAAIERAARSARIPFSRAARYERLKQLAMGPRVIADARRIVAGSKRESAKRRRTK
jgi:hypothetical protein